MSDVARHSSSRGRVVLWQWKRLARRSVRFSSCVDDWGVVMRRCVAVLSLLLASAAGIAVFPVVAQTITVTTVTACVNLGPGGKGNVRLRTYGPPTTTLFASCSSNEQEITWT